MTYQEFKNKHNGKHVEIGGSSNALNQCVDLANAYISEVLGLPIVLGTNAVDFPKKCLPPNYEYIENTLTGVPQQGDIMVWSSPDGIGHIGIYDSGDNTKFVSFDQNWPVGSVCKLVNHTYTGTYKVIGWLRGKSIIDNMDPVLDLIKANGITEGDIRWLIDLKANQTVTNLEKQIEEYREQIHEYEVELQSLIAENTQYQKEILNWQKDVSTANESLQTIEEELQTMTTDRDTWRKRYNDKNDAYNELLKGQVNIFIKAFNFIKSLFKK